MTKKAIITVGISASGKTTWAEKWCRENNGVNVNRDDIRFSVIHPGGDWSSYKFSKEKEKLVTKIQRVICQESYKLGKNLVLSDTNLNKSRVLEWTKFLEEDVGYKVEIKEFPISLEDAWKRDSQRGNGVGHGVIYKQYKQWNEYIGRRVYKGNEKSKAVIFDIDGTLAQMNGRSPFEWNRVGEDLARQPVVDMMEGYFSVGWEIIIMSGRDGVCMEETLDWLKSNIPAYVDYSFFMREEGDKRKDTVIKEEIFWRDVAENWNVKAVVDDRPCMVRLWWDIGIDTVICVGNPYLEF